MAHLPPENLPAFDPFSQSKTLFLPAPGVRGILVARQGAGFTRRSKKFTGASAALKWCEEKRIGLVYFFPPIASNN